jgi:hypothetical protein
MTHRSSPVTELLVRGEPSRGIAPGALKKAIEAALTAHAQRQQEPVAWRWKVSPSQLNWVYSNSPSPVPQFNVEPLYPAPAQCAPRCDKCGSAGDVFMLCSGCQSPLTSTERHCEFCHVPMADVDCCDSEFESKGCPHTAVTRPEQRTSENKG